MTARSLPCRLALVALGAAALPCAAFFASFEAHAAPAPSVGRAAASSRPSAAPRAAAATPSAKAPAAASLAPSAEHVPHIESEKYVLPENGLQVILSPDHSLPLVAVNVWYAAGPANEPAQRTGFAHLFEHLMFQGSAHVGDDQHFKLLESRGASYINGSTHFDITNYYETVPANELELALWLESDRMGFLSPAISPVSLENQRQVVMNERRWRVDNSPYGPSREKLLQTLLPAEHPYYGNIIGSMADLDRATVADVKQFYEQYYSPANASLVIAGDFDTAQAKAWVARYFGSIPPRQRPAVAHVVTPPVQSIRRVSVAEKVQLAQITKAWLSPKAFTPGDAEADILAIVLGQGEASRMHRRLVYELGLAQDVSVSQQSYGLTGIFSITATARPGADLVRLEAEIDSLLEAARHAPPTDKEVARAKNQLRAALFHELQGVGGSRFSSGRADLLNRYNYYLGTPNALPDDLKRYALVSPAAVAQFAQQTLLPNAQVVVVTTPES